MIEKTFTQTIFFYEDEDGFLKKYKFLNILVSDNKGEISYRFLNKNKINNLYLEKIYTHFKDNGLSETILAEYQTLFDEYSDIPKETFSTVEKSYENCYLDCSCFIRITHYMKRVDNNVEFIYKVAFNQLTYSLSFETLYISVLRPLKTIVYHIWELEKLTSLDNPDRSKNSAFLKSKALLTLKKIEKSLDSMGFVRL